MLVLQVYIYKCILKELSQKLLWLLVYALYVGEGVHLQLYIERAFPKNILIIYLCFICRWGCTYKCILKEVFQKELWLLIGALCVGEGVHLQMYIERAFPKSTLIIDICFICRWGCTFTNVYWKSFPKKYFDYWYMLYM